MALAGRPMLPIRRRMPTKAPPPPVAGFAYDWTGFYLGGHFGYAARLSNWSATQTGVAAPRRCRLARFLQRLQLLHGDRQLFCSASRPATITCPPRAGSLGVEADVSFPSFVGGNSTACRLLGFDRHWRTIPEQVEFSGTVRGRIGYAPRQHWLFYATGGFAWSYDQFTRIQLAGMPAGGTAVPGTVENAILVPRAGGAVGAGVEVALARRTGPRSSNICSPITATAASCFRPARSGSIPI